MDVMTGHIDHRILLNFRIEPRVLDRILPAPLRPKIVNGWAIGGICQVSLSRMRPRGLPAIVGTRSHNAAHRIAVEHPEGEGVYVPRRDTNSRINQLSGGRIFPGVYRRSKFEVESESGRYRVSIVDDEDARVMEIAARVVEDVPVGSVFASVEEASQFFERGNLGWSPGPREGVLDTIELATRSWNMAPLAVERAESSFFHDRSVFPEGSVEFDSGFVMRDLEHEWRALDGLECACS